MLKAEEVDWAKPPKWKSFGVFEGLENMLSNRSKGENGGNEAGEIGQRQKYEEVFKQH